MRLRLPFFSQDGSEEDEHDDVMDALSRQEEQLKRHDLRLRAVELEVGINRPSVLEESESGRSDQ
jgi:hypothetical protein